MRIHLISDLHLEGRYTAPAAVDADITCICGDLGYWVGPQADRLIKFLAAIPRPVYLVLGNHDFYYTINKDIKDSGGLDYCFRDVLRALPHVRLLHNDWAAVGKVQKEGDEVVLLYGTPLWSGFDLPLPDSILERLPKGVTSATAAHLIAAQGISDFRPGLVRGFSRLWSTDDHVTAHRDAASRLVEWLKLHPTGKRVVLTHWLPTEQCVAPRWMKHPLNCYFVACMDKAIARYAPDMWLFGHTHDHIDMHIGRTRLVANPIGYAGEDSRHDPGLVLEV